MAEANANQGLDKLFERMKSDLMYELRNIQHGEKPVTGKNNRENIDKFMTKCLSNNDGTGKQIADEDAESHRPESVVFEVQGIVERRPVSSILQSAAFRRQLENAIRGTIDTVNRSNRRTATVNRTSTQSQSSANDQRQSPRVPVPRPRASAGTAHRDRASPPAPRLPPPRPLVRQDSSDSISSVDSFSSAVSSVDIDDADFAEDATAPQAHPAASASPGVPEPQAEDPPHRNLTWEELRRARRGDLVEEISDLLRHRLVSSMLDSQFRARLELHVQNQVAATGTNGQEVQNLIQSLPPSGVLRNDFTDIGIPPPQDLSDNFDTISVTNVSSHSVPYTQTNTHLSREIQGLKAQMAEMKNMIKLTFDMQMDLQRAIRQEVAAAMGAVAGAAAAPPASAAPPSRPVNDTRCSVCLEKDADSVLYQCGHMCVCYVCGRDLMSRGHNCPVCRAPIKDVIRAYKSN